MSRIIATVGKGGVGKTSVSACFVKLLCEHFSGKRILAIDADPAVGLATALGVNVELTLDDIRREIVREVESDQPRNAAELLNDARFRILDAMTETNGFSFIAIGRPESSGCYCKVNAYLKEVITLLATDFDFVVIDGEAGIEQINRRVMNDVTDLVMISDASRKGLDVLDNIKSVADSLMQYSRCGVILNRIIDLSVVPQLRINSAEILSVIPCDNEQVKNDMLGESVFSLSDSSAILAGARAALIALDVFGVKEND